MMQEQRRGRRQQGDQKIDFELMQEWSRHYEFSRCIVEHNLEDETGAKLDFSNKLAITKLDPKIGSEIERLIDELNQEEEEGEGLDEEGFTRLSGESLEEPSLSTSPEEDTLIVQ